MVSYLETPEPPWPNCRWFVWNRPPLSLKADTRVPRSYRFDVLRGTGNLMDDEITTSLELTEVVALCNLSSSLPHHLAKIKLQYRPFLLGIPWRKDPSNRFSADSWAIGVKLSFQLGPTACYRAIGGRKKVGEIHVIRKVVTSRKRLKIREMTWFRKTLFTWHCVSTSYLKSCLVLVQSIPSKAASVFASNLTMMDCEIISPEIQLEEIAKGCLFDPFEFLLRTWLCQKWQRNWHGVHMSR